MRESLPTTAATSSMSAPVASQSAETALMEDTRWARKALATSFDSSADQSPVVSTRSAGTQRW